MSDHYFRINENALASIVKPQHGETRSPRLNRRSRGVKCGGTWMSVVLGPGYGNSTPVSSHQRTPSEGIVNLLNSRHNGKKWVWGHMLNAAWGGTGAYKNVVPLTANGTGNNANSMHSNEVEKKISKVLQLSANHVRAARAGAPNWLICVKYDVEIIIADSDYQIDKALRGVCDTLGVDPYCLPRGINCTTEIKLVTPDKANWVDVPAGGFDQAFIWTYLPEMPSIYHTALIKAVNQLPSLEIKN